MHFLSVTIGLPGEMASVLYAIPECGTRPTSENNRGKTSVIHHVAKQSRPSEHRELSDRFNLSII